jgi:hypothetical protein
MAMRAIRLCTDFGGSFHDNRSRFTSRFLAAGFQGIAKLLLSLKPVVLIKPVGAAALYHISHMRVREFPPRESQYRLRLFVYLYLLFG